MSPLDVFFVLPRLVIPIHFSPRLLTEEQEAAFLLARVKERKVRRRKARESLQLPVEKKQVFFKEVHSCRRELVMVDLTPSEDLFSVGKEDIEVKEGGEDHEDVDEL